jgi:hypothetical protein
MSTNIIYIKTISGEDILCCLSEDDYEYHKNTDGLLWDETVCIKPMRLISYSNGMLKLVSWSPYSKVHIAHLKKEHILFVGEPIDEIADYYSQTLMALEKYKDSPEDILELDETIMVH